MLVWFHGKLLSIIHLEAHPLGLAAESWLLYKMSPTSMERVNVSVLKNIKEGKKILLEAGDLKSCDQQARSKPLEMKMNKTKPALSFLSDDGLKQIEETAYQLLEEVGISLDHSLAVEMMDGQGCRVQDDRVLIPPESITWALDNVKPHQTFCHRNGDAAFTMGDGQLRFHNGGGVPFVFDQETGEQRRAVLEDIVDATRVLDALPHVEIVYPLYGPYDVPAELLAIEATAATLRNTDKPVVGAAIDRPQDIPYILEMFVACCGGKKAFMKNPNTAFFISPVSPLTFSEEGAGAIIAAAQTGAPFYSLPAPLLGGTAPVSMAGAVAQQHAEMLASLLIAAAAQPGVEVGYCSRISPLDMKSAASSWGGPEVGMTGAVAGQLAHRLGLPCDTYGFNSSSMVLDPQFAFERLANVLTPALAGVDLLSGIGCSGDGTFGGIEIMIIDNEIAGLVKHIVGGCPVNEGTLAYDVMKSVIPGEGMFLSELHTVQQVREEDALWLPGISARSKEDTSLLEASRALGQELLSSHQVEPMPEAINQEIDEILEKARRELVKE